MPKWQRTVRTDEKPYQAGTLAQLAELIGVSADHLERTVAEFKPLEKDGLATRGLHPPNSKCSHHREATLPRMADQLCQLLHTRRTSLQHLGADR